MTEIEMLRRSIAYFGGVICLSTLAAILVSGAVVARAQQAGSGYRLIDVPADAVDDTPDGKKKRMDRERRAVDILRSETWPVEAERRSELDTWIRVYRFAVLTRPEVITRPENSDLWVVAREDFTRRLLAQIRNPQMREHVIGVVRQVTEAIARGNFHPVARYNAMLLLGHVNSRDAVTFGDRRPEVPMMELLPLMLNELQSPQQIDAVRVAALVGIHRHVRVDRDLPEGSRRLVGNAAENAIVDAMAGLLEAQPPEGRSVEAHIWMQRRAADILGVLGSTGQGNRVVAALERVVGDEAAPLDLRLSAGDALGQLNYPANANINALAIAKNLGIVAVLACYEEIKRVEAQQARDEARKKRPPGTSGMPYGDGMLDGGLSYADDMYGDMYDSGMYDMGGPGGMGMGLGGPAKPRKKPRGPLGYRIDLTRRQVLSQLLPVRRALTGHERYATQGLLALTAAGNGQEEVKTILARVDEIMGVVAPSLVRSTEPFEFHTIDDMIAEIRKKVQKMEDECRIVVQRPTDELDLPEDPDELLEPQPEGMPDLTLDLPPDDEMPEDAPVDPEMPVEADDPVEPGMSAEPVEPEELLNPELMDPAEPADPAELPEAPEEPGDD
jgi:hypothetical protein